jgi:hypothetical protein
MPRELLVEAERLAVWRGVTKGMASMTNRTWTTRWSSGLQDQSGDAPDDGRPQSGRAEARCRREIGELASKVGEQ